MLSRLVTKFYALMVEIVLWIYLIAFSIGGACFGYVLTKYNEHIIGSVLGLIIGAGIGFLSCVLLGGGIITAIDLATTNRQILEKLNQKSE